MYNRVIDFDSPFKNNCYGVVVTQSYINKSIDNRETTANLAVTSFNKNSFTLSVGKNEILKPIYYIAFGM